VAEPRTRVGRLRFERRNDGTRDANEKEKKAYATQGKETVEKKGQG